MHHLHQIGKSHPNVAYLYAILGNVCMASIQILVKQVSQTLTTFHIIIIRSICMICFNLYTLKSNQLSPYVKDPENFKLVVMRILAISTSSTIMLYCLHYMPVSTVSTIFNMGPIFIFFIEAVAYQKALNVSHLGLASVSFLGIMLILQPSFLFGSTESQKQNQLFYVCFMVASAFLFAFNLHLVHVLAKKMHVFINVHYSHILFLFLNGILSQFSPKKISLDDITPVLVISVVGIVISTIGAQYLIMMANSIKAPSLMMPFGYVAIMFGFIADIYLFKTEFSWLAVIGIILTSSGLLSGYLVSKSVEKDKQQRIES